MPKKKRRPRTPAARRPDHRPHPSGRGATDDRAAAQHAEAGRELRDAEDQGRDGGRLPHFLDQVPDEATMHEILADADEHALLLDAPLMRRADALLRTIGSGHPYREDEDEDGGRAATQDLIAKTGWAATGEITTAWHTARALVAGLVGGGFLEHRDGNLVPAAGVAPWAWPDDAPEERVVAGRILFATTLGAFFADDQDGISAAQAPPLTAMALMSAVAPGGIHLPDSTDEPDTVAHLQRAVRADLLALEEIGIVTREDDTFFASPVLITVLPAVVADMETRLG